MGRSDLPIGSVSSVSSRSMGPSAVTRKVAKPSCTEIELEPNIEQRDTRLPRWLHRWEGEPSSTKLAAMRALAMRFRSVLRGGDVEKLTVWLHDAQHSVLYGVRRFAQTLTLDLAAVRNAITERWSNGQVEGQINRLKMLKRTMYGHTLEWIAPRQNNSVQIRRRSHSVRQSPDCATEPDWLQRDTAISGIPPPATRTTPRSARPAPPTPYASHSPPPGRRPSPGYDQPSGRRRSGGRSGPRCGRHPAP